MSNFDVPATYQAPGYAQIWNEVPGSPVRPRCIAGMHDGIEVAEPWSALPFDLVAAGQVRLFTFADCDARAARRPLGGTGMLGCFVFAEPAVLRLGDPVRVDGELVGHIGGFAGPFVAIASWHRFCGGELEAGPSTLLQIGGTPQ